MISNNPDPNCAYFAGTGNCNTELLNYFIQSVSSDAISSKNKGWRDDIIISPPHKIKPINKL